MLDSLPEGMSRPSLPPHSFPGLPLGSYDPALSHMMGKFWGLLSPPASDQGSGASGEDTDNKMGLGAHSGVPGLLGSPFPKFSALPRLGQPHAASPSRGSGLGQGPAYITCNCGQSFASLSQLERHMSSEHPENTNLPCSLCSKQFPTFNKLQRHMSNHADGPDLRKFKCSHCGKAFKFKHHLKEHERIHTGEKPFECKNCGKRFSHSGSYSSHTTSKKCLIGGGRANRQQQQALTDSKTQFPGSGGSRHSLTPGSVPSWSPASWSKQTPPAPGLSAKTPDTGFPLSPPLESLRAGFPCPPVSGLGFPGLPLAHTLPQLLLQAQYQQLLSRSQAPQAPIEPGMNPHEYLQRLFQIRQEMGLSDLISKEHAAASVPAPPATEPKLGKVEVLQSSQIENQRSLGPMTPFTETREECASPPRMGDIIKKEEDNKDKIGQENGFHVADSIKNSFRDPHHFEMIKNMIEGVNKNTTKQMLGEAVTGEVKQEWDMDDDQCDESIASEDGAGGQVPDDRKVRVRTLISEEQSMVLKTHYQINPRPKREELDAIARKIGHPFKVVKVWFQNARARDRREGKNLPHLPGFPPSHASHPPFLNNNFQLGSLPRLPLPFLRPGGIPEHFSKLNSLFPFSNLQNFCRDESKSPESIKSENIDDEMEEDEEETPLDLSNKGSTPGASPSLDKEEQFSRASINFSKLGASFSNNGFGNTSSDEEDLTNKVIKKPLKMGDNKDHPRPHQCDSCDKAFKLKHHLIEHKRLHTGDKPYQCKKCLRKFSHSGSYSQHINHRFSSCKPADDALTAGSTDYSSVDPDRSQSHLAILDVLSVSPDQALTPAQVPGEGGTQIGH